MSEMDIPALTIVGMEGLFGCLALFGCILPIAQARANPATLVASLTGCRAVNLSQGKRILCIRVSPLVQMASSAGSAAVLLEACVQGAHGWLYTKFHCGFLLLQFLPGQEGGGLREDSLESWHMITHDQVRRRRLAEPPAAVALLCSHVCSHVCSPAPLSKNGLRAEVKRPRPPGGRRR